jgi:hypothetical protein
MSGKSVELKLVDHKKMDTFVEKGSANDVAVIAPAQPAVVAMRQLTVEIPDSLHAQLRMQCARLDVKSYEVVRRALSIALGELETFERTAALAWLGRGN